MRSSLPPKLESGRLTTGRYASPRDAGPWGAFFIRAPSGIRLKIIASEGLPDMPWEHVSVSTEKRAPSWEEMCFVKGLFWEPEECVMQLHPPESEYVNNHPHCLHLWKPVGIEIPTPPAIMVGIKGVSPAQTKRLLGVE